ncbi:MAG: hypothetical protein DWQ36_08610 [Acidobacteria bacterium]|nr:MAG: hypothetical protein DWQ30_22795 [Acidobacteriota bacterium]REK08705.1 MAG: hypothetical protein DWQ36_08610 [Acidobacteriota bacterium]
MNRRREDDAPHGRLFPPDPRQAVDDELSFHIEERAAELEREGMDAAAAGAEARRRFGAVEAVRAQCLELSQQGRVKAHRRDRWLGVVSDLRTAARSLRRDWRYSVTVVVALALGLGGVWAIGGLVYEVLVRPLPFADPQRLVIVWQNDRATGTRREPASYPDYLDLAERSRTLEALAAYSTAEANFGFAGGEPRRVQIARTSHEMLRVLGREPLRGRAFSAEEASPAGASVALLSERFWNELWDGDVGVLGETVRIDEQPAEVIGVVPADLEIPGRDVDIWLPLQADETSAPRYRHGTSIVARLAPDVPLAAAQEEASAIHRALEQEYPQTNQDRGAFVEPVVDVLRGEVRPTLLTLMAAGCLVLVLVCANVGNLLLLRMRRLAAELDLRTALGATRGRLGLRFAAESAMLMALAGVLGWVVAMLSRRAVLGLSEVPELGSLALLTHDAGGLATWRLAAVGLLCLVGVVFALLPWARLRSNSALAALHGSRVRGGERRRARPLRRLLVATQIGLALPLVCGAAALSYSLDKLRALDPGFDASAVVRMSYSLPNARYPRDFASFPHWAEVNDFNRRLLEQVRALPGVEAAGLTSHHPLESGFTNSFLVVGRAADDPVHSLGEIRLRMVSPGYFETNRTRLLSGRWFDERDTVEQPAVALLGEVAAQRLFPEGDAIGQRIAFWGIERTVVGVVADERVDGLDADAPFAMYVNLLQAPQTGSVTLMVRAETGAGGERSELEAAVALVTPVREIVRRLDPSLALYDVATMSGTVARSLAQRRLALVLFGAFSLLALVLAAMGIYTVLSAMARERRQELGVRLALGASPRRLLTEVVSRGLRLGVAGVLLGALLSFALLRSLDTLLYQVEPLDPRLLGGAILAVLALTVAASWIPARRAAGTDPARTLTVE